MSRIELFSDLVNHTEEKFIGFGNPESDILIVGKECAGTDRDPWAFTTTGNCTKWKEILHNPSEPERCIFKNPSLCKPELFSPRFAFKGQLNTWNRVKKVHRNPDTGEEWREFCDNGGTSLTWLKYQQIIKPIEREQVLTFQNHCFLTELSDKPLPNSSKGRAEDAVVKRVTTLFPHPFFQSFPVVIAACKGYLPYIPNGIEQLFPNAKKLIITKQLSMFVSNDYINRIVGILNTESEERIVEYL